MISLKLTLLISLFDFLYCGAMYCVPRNETTGLPSPCWPTADKWEALKGQLSGTLTPLHISDYTTCVKQGTNAAFKLAAIEKGLCMQYHDCSKAFCDKNGKWNIPSYSVEAINVNDIKAALSFAERHNIAVTVKTSGHSYSGSSMGYGTLLIWMHNFEKLTDIKNTFSDTCNTQFTDILQVGGGQSWKEAYNAVGERFHIVGGGGMSVSAAGGWLMGGGLSALSRKFGMGVDNVVQMKLVLANGRHVVADACTNSDLFWALRGGGGGTFGVLTHAYYRLHPVSTVLLLTMSIMDIAKPPHPTETVFSFLDFWVEKSPYLDRRWGGYWTLNSFILYFQGNREEANSTFLADFDIWMRSLSTQQQKAVSIEKYFVSSYYASRGGIYAPADPTGEKDFNIANRIVPRETVVNKKEETKEVLKWMVWNGFYTFNYLLGGAMTNVSINSTSVNPAFREAIWQIETFDERLTNKIRSSFGNASGYNHGSKSEPDWENAFWGSHSQRLKELKKKYDPGSRFNCWHCIGYQEMPPYPGPSSAIQTKLSAVVTCLCLILYYWLS